MGWGGGGSGKEGFDGMGVKGGVKGGGLREGEGSGGGIILECKWSLKRSLSKLNYQT